MNLLEQTDVRSKVLKKLGLEGLSFEYQNEALKDIEDTISQRLLIAIHEKLSTDEQKEFEVKSSLGIDADAREYLESKMSGFNALAEKVALSVVEEYKQNALEEADSDDMIDDVDDDDDEDF